MSIEVRFEAGTVGVRVHSKSLKEKSYSGSLASNRRAGEASEIFSILTGLDLIQDRKIL
jgi:hypothetical protein